MDDESADKIVVVIRAQIQAAEAFGGMPESTTKRTREGPQNGGGPVVGESGNTRRFTYD